MEKLILHTFSEWLLRHNSYIFGAAIFRAAAFFSFFRRATFSQQLFFQNSFIFQSKNSTAQPLLKNKKFFVSVTFQNNYFFPVYFKAGFSAQYQLFQKSYILEKANFSGK